MNARGTLVAAAGGAWLLSLCAVWPAHGTLLNWDEASYVEAAGQGAWANVSDAGSLGPSTFFRFARAKWRGHPAALPEGYDETRDPLLLRNLHPPLVVLTIVPVAHARDERVLRWGLVLGALALAAALLWAYAVLGRDPFSRSWAGLLAMAVLAAWAGRLGFAALHCHGWMSVWAVVSTALLVLWIAHPRPRTGVLLCASLALCLFTLHTGIVLWAAAALSVVVWARRTETRIPLRLVQGLALTLALSVLLWPGLVLRVSLAKMFAYYAYIARGGQEYVEHWQRLCAVSLGLLPLLVAGPLAVLALARRSAPGAAARWGAPALMTMAYAATVAPFAIVPQYGLPALAPLMPLVGVAIDESPARTRPWLALAVVALAALSWANFPVWVSDQERRADLQWMGGALSGRTVLADGAHIYRHYLGPAYAVAPLTVSWDGKALLLRERGTYHAASASELRGTMVLVRRHRKRLFAEDVNVPALAGCRRIERPTLMAFDCGGDATP